MKFLIALLGFFIAYNPTDVSAETIYKTSLLEARETALTQHTPYIVIFEAEWCTPCQWMENFTLNDDLVTNYIRENYSAVKVNIDEFEGFSLKEKYKVTALPTILIFDNQNEIIGRYENTYRSNEFVDLLKWHSDFKRTKANVREQKTLPSTQPISNPIITHEETVTSANTINNTNPCTIQIGAFASFDNAQKMQNKIQSQFATQRLKIYILENEKYPYRVTIGDFANPEDATKLLFDLDKKGVAGIVKKKRLFGK